MCLFKAKIRNTKTVFEICSKSTVKTLEGSQWGRSCVFIVNFEQIPLIVLMFALPLLTKQMPPTNHEAPLHVVPTKQSFDFRFSKSLEKWNLLSKKYFPKFHYKKDRKVHVASLPLPQAPLSVFPTWLNLRIFNFS